MQCAENGDRKDNEDQTERGKETHTGQEDLAPSPGAMFPPTAEVTKEWRAGKGLLGEAGGGGGGTGPPCLKREQGLSKEEKMKNSVQSKPWEMCRGQGVLRDTEPAPWCCGAPTLSLPRIMPPLSQQPLILC